MRTGDRPAPGGNGVVAGMDSGPAASMRCADAAVAAGVEVAADVDVTAGADAGVSVGTGAIVAVTIGFTAMVAVDVGVQVGIGAVAVGEADIPPQAASPANISNAARIAVGMPTRRIARLRRSVETAQMRLDDVEHDDHRQ